MHGRTLYAVKMRRRPARTPSRRSRVRFGARGLTLLLGLVSASSGCASIEWIPFDFNRAETLAREQNTYLFIYYRWWMSPECAAVERDVLSHPDVISLFGNTVNSWLHQEWEPNRQIMADRYGVQTVPAFVIVAPDGDFRKLTSVPSVDQFQRFVRSAIPDAAAPATGPAP